MEGGSAEFVVLKAGQKRERRVPTGWPSLPPSEARMKILKAGTHVLVCDGANTLLLKNVGDAIAPKLSVVHSQKQSVPPTRELGRDAPPRVHQRVGTKRSSMERPHLHDRQEERFARDIAQDIEARLSSDKIGS
jgi:protein required for attachment to host cells